MVNCWSLPQRGLPWKNEKKKKKKPSESKNQPCSFINLQHSVCNNADQMSRFPRTLRGDIITRHSLPSTVAHALRQPDPALLGLGAAAAVVVAGINPSQGLIPREEGGGDKEGMRGAWTPPLQTNGYWLWLWLLLLFPTLSLRTNNYHIVKLSAHSAENE